MRLVIPSAVDADEAATVLDAVAVQITDAGGVVRYTPDRRSLKFSRDVRTARWCWMGAIEHGRVTVSIVDDHVLVYARADCLAAFAVTSVMAVPMAPFVGVWTSLGVWLVIVVANYVTAFATFDTRMRTALRSTTPSAIPSAKVGRRL